MTLFVAFVASITLRITIKQIQWCSLITLYGGKFDACLIVVLVDCPCWRSIVRSSTIFAGPCALINLILYCRQSGRRGTVESVLTSCTRINFDVRIAACVKCDRPWLVHGHPAENSTAIVHGKWPSNGPGHAADGLFRAFVVDYCTKSVWPPYSYISFITLRTNQVLVPIAIF
jgi:hypothetical protein